MPTTSGLLREAGTLRFLLQEAFIALLPYVLFISMFALINQLINSNLAILPGFDFDLMLELEATSRTLMPFLITASLAYHGSIAMRTDRLTAVFLSVLLFLLNVAALNHGSLADLPSGASLTCVIIPLVVNYLLRAVVSWTQTVPPQLELYPGLATSLGMVGPFMLAFVGAGLVVWLSNILLSEIVEEAIRLAPLLEERTVLMLLEVMNGLTWFLGLNGGTVVEMVAPPGLFNEQIVPNLSRGTFIELFVGFGGSGAVLALILAILLEERGGRLRSIALVSLPFAFFNISEPIIFGLPLILNYRFLIPFLAVPLINMAASYYFVTAGYYAFLPVTTPWTTPIGVSAYLHSEAVWPVVHQFVLLGLDTLIYLPFVIRFARSQNHEGHDGLSDRLELNSGLKLQLSRRYQQDLGASVETRAKISAAIDLIRDNELVLHYQPKFRVESYECVGFEALLRLRLANGKIMGPSFLPLLEQAGFASAIDNWVCQQVQRDLPSFESREKRSVSINLHPDTFGDERFVSRLIEDFSGKDVSFEIIERGVCGDKAVIAQMIRMREAGLRLEVDDFGSGYANLSTLSTLPVSTIKLDKSLLDQASTPKGRLLYGMIAQVCAELGFEVTAEGVENGEQLALIKDCSVAYAQGWLFSKALPLDEAVLVSHADIMPAVSAPKPAA